MKQPLPSVLVALAALASSPALADITRDYDAEQCALIARKFADNQFTMNVGELDVLQRCAGILKAVMVEQGPRGEGRGSSRSGRNRTLRDTE